MDVEREEGAQVAVPEEDPLWFPDDDGPQRKAGRWLSDAGYEIAVAKEAQVKEAQAKWMAQMEDEKAAQAQRAITRTERERSAERKAQSPLQEHEGGTDRARNIIMKDIADETAARPQRTEARLNKMWKDIEDERAARAQKRRKERRAQQSQP